MFASPYAAAAGISGWGPSGPPSYVKEFQAQQLGQNTSKSKGSGAGSTDSLSYFQKLLSASSTKGASAEASAYGPEVAAEAGALGSGAASGAASGSY